MSKAFAWGKHPTEKQKEVMTPSALLSTGKEPKIHHKCFIIEHDMIDSYQYMNMFKKINDH